MGGSGGLERAGVRRSSGRTKKQLSKRSDELICINILTLEMSGVDRRPAKEGEEVGANEFSVRSYYMEPMHGLGERVLRARAVLGNLFPACCAAPPARMRQMQSPLLCARGCRAMFAARAKVACVRPHAAPGFRVVARWGGQIAAWADLEEGVEATLDSFHRNKTEFFPWS